MKKVTLLCIGGELDGQRIRVESYDGATPTSTEYFFPRIGGASYLVARDTDPTKPEPNDHLKYVTVDFHFPGGGVYFALVPGEIEARRRGLWALEMALDRYPRAGAEFFAVPHCL